VPEAWEVRPADVVRVAHHGGDLNPIASRERMALLAGVLRTNQINFIDPTPDLVKHDGERRMYNLYDIHFTVAGNHVFAESALPAIQEIVLREQSSKP
jgi:hypothetical protein